jgi:hypothetical protein
MESLERPFWPQDRIKNDKRSDGRIGIEGSDRTIFDKKCFPWGSYAPFTKIQRSHIDSILISEKVMPSGFAVVVARKKEEFRRSLRKIRRIL